MERITVITADIISSRSLGRPVPGWASRLSQIRSPSLLTPFTTSRGDEIQAVLKGWLQEPSIARRLRHACRPVNLRIGIGLGVLEGEISATSSWDMDGPAFHLAREALDGLKKARGPRTVVRSHDAWFDKVVTTIWLLIDTIEETWTQPQWDAIHVYETEKTYRQAAEQLGVRPQNVEKRCKSARWQSVREAETILQMMGERLGVPDHPLEGDPSQITFPRVISSGSPSGK